MVHELREERLMEAKGKFGEEKMKEMKRNRVTHHRKRGRRTRKSRGTE